MDTNILGDVLNYLRNQRHRHRVREQSSALRLDMPLTIDVAVPFAPLKIRSKQKVEFLNADRLDGYHYSDVVSAFTGPLLDGDRNNDTYATTVLRGMLGVGQNVGGTIYWKGLTLGAAGKILRSDGTDLLYSTFTIADTYAQGAFPVASAANVLSALTLGTVGKFLRSDGTDLKYSTTTIPDTFTQYDLLYASAANVLAAIATNAAATKKFLRTFSSGAPSYEQVDYGDLSSVPSTFTPTAHDILSTSHGDTLADTILAGDILIGNATPKLSRLAKGDDDDVLTIDSGTHLPTWAAPAAGGITDIEIFLDFGLEEATYTP